MLWTERFCPLLPPHLYVKILTPNVMALGDGALGGKVEPS